MKRDWNQEAHNQGQKDGAEGKYDNPFKGGPLGIGDDLERAEKYDDGYESGKNNRK